MGLDIALGLVILSSAIRGWMRGFVLQAIRLGGLVGCVFAADPARDYIRPHVAPHLASIRPELLDRLLWWGAAVATYVVTTGIAILAVRMHRKRTFGLEENHRGDQFAGFLLGGIKGLVIAAFLVAGIQKFAIDRVKGVDWAEEQTRSSQAMAWDLQYRPADRIWSAPPIQKFLAHIKEHGLRPIDAATSLGAPRTQADEAPVATADRPPRLDLPGPDGADLRGDVDRLLKELERFDRR